MNESNEASLVMETTGGPNPVPRMIMVKQMTRKVAKQVWFRMQPMSRHDRLTRFCMLVALEYGRPNAAVVLHCTKRAADTWKELTDGDTVNFEVSVNFQKSVYSIEYNVSEQERTFTTTLRVEECK